MVRKKIETSEIFFPLAASCRLFAVPLLQKVNLFSTGLMKIDIGTVGGYMFLLGKQGGGVCLQFQFEQEKEEFCETNYLLSIKTKWTDFWPLAKILAQSLFRIFVFYSNYCLKLRSHHYFKLLASD